MKFIQNYEKFKKSRNFSSPKSVGLNPDQLIKWSDVQEGIRVLQHQQLNEGFFGDLYNKAKSGLLSITSKIPGLKKLSQNKEIEQVASNLLQRGDIDDMLKKAYDKVMREKGEVTPNTIEEVAEEEEQRPLILPAIGSKQLGELTSKQKWIGRSLLLLILLSISVKASGMDKQQVSDVKLDKTEMTKNLKGETVKTQTIKFADAMAGMDVDPTDDGQVNYLHSSSSASKAYQSELGKGGDFDKGLPRGADGTYNHVYEITLSNFYKIVEGVKSGQIDRSQVLSSLKPLAESPNSSNPNLFQIGGEILKAPNGQKIDKLFDMKGKDGSTKIRLSGNGLYNFGRLIEAASKLNDNQQADFIKITFGGEVSDTDARGAFSFSFDADGFGKSIGASLNKIYCVMRAAAFTVSDFQDPDPGDSSISPLIPNDYAKDRVEDGITKKIVFVNFFKTKYLFTTKDGGEYTIQDLIEDATDYRNGDDEQFFKTIRGICKFSMIEGLFESKSKDLPNLLSKEEIKNLNFDNVNDDLIKECVDYFKKFKNQSDDIRLNAKLDPSLEKKFLDDVRRVVNSALDKYVDYKLSQSEGDPYRALPVEVLDAIKADVKKQVENRVKIHPKFKEYDLKVGYEQQTRKPKTPEEKQKDFDDQFLEGEF